MRASWLTWVQRLVGFVFLIGLGAIAAAVVILVRSSEGVPPMPFFAGLIGAAALVLLAGACLALMSIARSVRLGAGALQQMARRSTKGETVQVFTPSPLQNAPRGTAAEPAAAAPRPSGKILVAER